MTFVRTFEDAISFLTQEVEILRKKADENIPKPINLVKLPSLESNKATYDSFWKWGYYNDSLSTIEQADKLYASALEMVEKDKQKIEEIHSLNEQAIENNKLIRNRVQIIMKDVLGISDTHSEVDHKSRARTTKYISVKAGYLGDLDRKVPVCDGYELSICSLDQVKKSIQAKYESVKSKIRKELAEKEKTEKESLEIKELAYFQVKYGLTPNHDWDDVLLVIRDKNKYLDLGCAMEDTRNDWSDGFYRVKHALQGFVAETKEEEDVVNELEEILASDEDDGRVFRDCTYNYGYMYSNVKHDELLKDFHIVRGYIE